VSGGVCAFASEAESPRCRPLVVYSRNHGRTDIIGSVAMPSGDG